MRILVAVPRLLHLYPRERQPSPPRSIFPGNYTSKSPPLSSPPFINLALCCIVQTGHCTPCSQRRKKERCAPPPLAGKHQQPLSNPLQIQHHDQRKRQRATHQNQKGRGQASLACSHTLQLSFIRVAWTKRAIACTSCALANNTL